MEEDIINKSKHIVFLGETGFPKGLASIQRMTLMARSLLQAGCKVTVLCRKGTWPENEPTEYGPAGTHMGIDYVYTSGSVIRPRSFVRRNVKKIKGAYKEYLYLKKLKSQNKLDVAIISCMSSAHVLRYRLYSRLIGFPIVLNFVELASSMKQRNSIKKKINDHFFDHYIIRLVDGALPISEKLIDYYKDNSPAKPILKLPILCDFDQFVNKPPRDASVRFLYCGAASYYELIDFILNAFDQVKSSNNTSQLELVLGGKESELERVKKRIEQSQRKGNIILTTNVSHTEIPNYYDQASALLIPLRPTAQDAARFPHKIGEYLASGRPMITTAYGEINYYDFVDGQTALIAPSYDVKSFAEKMNFVVDHQGESFEIGQKGRQMGLENFNFSSHSQRLLDFLMTLDKKRPNS